MLILMEGAAMRWIFVLYQGERAFYAGSVLFWYSTGIKGDVRRGDNRKDTRDDSRQHQRGGSDPNGAAPPGPPGGGGFPGPTPFAVIASPAGGTS